MADVKPLYISQFKSGLVNAVDATIMPDDGFTRLVNAYCWRDGVVIQQGYSPLSRLRRDLSGETGGSGSVDGQEVTYDLLSDLSLETSSGSIVPATFSATLASGLTLTDSNSTGILTLGGTIGTATGATLSYATGEVVITYSSGAATSLMDPIDVSYYPGLPVMGIFQHIDALDGSITALAFDTTYAYEYNQSNERYEEWISGTTWSGGEFDYFQGITYYQNGTAANSKSLFWVTNATGASGDPIRYSDGSTWTDFAPTTSGSDELHQCSILVSYKDRLVALNTWEGATQATSTNFRSRARWSQNGNPLESDAWDDGTPGKGGYIDAGTQEAIVSASFVKDTLIVGFERSTWALTYTGNEALPFIWKRINDTQGIVSHNSSCQFDDYVLGISSEGVILSNANTLERIDTDKIPDIIQEFAKNFSSSGVSQGNKRIQGIRDYDIDLCYWTFVDSSNGSSYADSVLIYNYNNNSFALSTDSFTTYGYFQSDTTKTWSDYTEATWSELSTFTWSQWGVGFQSPKQIIAGNQQGFLFILNQQINNSHSLCIREIASGSPAELTVIDHNLFSGDIIKIQGCLTNSGTATELNDNVFQVTVIDTDTISLMSWDEDGQQFVAFTLEDDVNYLGGGTINVRQNFEIRSKMFNIADIGASIGLSYIDILAERTDSGEVTMPIFVDYDTANEINPSDGDSFFNTYFLTSDEGQTSSSSPRNIWHRFYCPIDANMVQFGMTYTNAQIVDDGIYNSAFLMKSMILWLSQTGEIR